MTPAIQYVFAAKLIRVIDGDTAVLDVDLGFQVHYACHVRFMRYNAPELHGPHPGQGAAAKAELEAVLTGKQLLITTSKDFSQTFARYLAEVYVIEETGGFWVADHMISKGFSVKQGQ